MPNLFSIEQLLKQLEYIEEAVDQKINNAPEKKQST